MHQSREAHNDFQNRLDEDQDHLQSWSQREKQMIYDSHRIDDSCACDPKRESQNLKSLENFHGLHRGCCRVASRHLKIQSSHDALDVVDVAKILKKVHSGENGDDHWMSSNKNRYYCLDDDIVIDEDFGDDWKGCSQSDDRQNDGHEDQMIEVQIEAQRSPLRMAGEHRMKKKELETWEEVEIHRARWGRERRLVEVEMKKRAFQDNQASQAQEKVYLSVKGP